MKKNEQVSAPCPSLWTTSLKIGLVFIFILCGWMANAQQTVTVSGTVTDQNNSPLPGVSIMEKGTNKGVTTATDGSYQIKAGRNAVLVYTYIGFTAREIPVAGKSRLDIQLTEDSKTLSELVVVGYGVQKKSSVTGAISQVKSGDMENRTITRPEQALQGKTAGVQIIQTSGSPGASPTVRVRGFSSNYASDPLYVVDGLRTTNIGGIDPNDIESMEVLKDAASAAIYGAEAGNGVIMITTKKGKEGQTRIAYDYQRAIQSLSYIPEVMNSQQYIKYMTEGNLILQSAIDASWDGKTNTKWTDVAFENSVMDKHNISFTGGNHNGSFYASASMLNNDGIVKGPNDNYNRFTGTINADYRIKPWMKVGVNNQIEKYKIRSVSENSEYGSLLAAVLTLDPLTPDVYDAANLPDFMKSYINVNNYNLLKNSKGQYYALSAFQESEQVHPMIMRDKATNKNDGFSIMGTAFAEFNPIKGFTFTSRLGYNLQSYNNYSFSQDYYANATAKQDYNMVNSTSGNSVYYQWENFANYNADFGNHHINAMAGMSYSEINTNYVTGSANAIKKDDPLFAYLNYATSEATKTVSGEPGINTKLSYFGRFGYSFSNRYMIEGSLRADAADLSILPAENRWGYFPALSGGWVVSNEKFMAPISKTMDYLKLRASWGQNGSIAGLGSYKWNNAIGSGVIYPFTNSLSYSIGSYPGTLGNKNLKWETSEQLDLGFDARFFNSRLSLSVDYFTKKTKDLIVSNVIPSLAVGNTASPMNAGDVENKGVEVELGWKGSAGDFKYSVRANMATLTNKVTYLDKSITRIDGASFHTYAGVTAFEVGQPVWYFRGYKLEKIDQATGDPVFADINKDGIINDADKTNIGSAIPDFTCGITISAAWKGFDFTLFGTGSKGNDIYNFLNRPDRPTGNKLLTFYEDRWTTTNTNASRPRPGCNNEDKYWISDAVVFDGSYFKIKQLQLGYTLPESLIKRISVSSVRAYLSLDDWFMFTKYPGFDPEASAGSTSAMGLDKGAYPTSRKVVVGVNISF